MSEHTCAVSNEEITAWPAAKRRRVGVDVFYVVFCVVWIVITLVLQIPPVPLWLAVWVVLGGLRAWRISKVVRGRQS